MKKASKLTDAERSEIYILHAKGYSARSIAKALGRSPNTVANELKRNGYRDGRYVATRAKQKAYVRRKYAKYQGKGLVVLGFPSNDFGQQEPGTSKAIADFCFNTYGVKFPMFSKSVVKGTKRNALYEDLFQATQVAPGWNFHKYLIDRRGKVVANYASEVTPNSAGIVSGIEKALSQKL